VGSADETEALEAVGLRESATTFSTRRLSSALAMDEA
jgi:hypothetical protein